MNMRESAFSDMTRIYRGLASLGLRTLAGCGAALIAACLIFAAPEVGLAGAIGGIGIGVVSAVLMHRPTA